MKIEKLTKTEIDSLSFDPRDIIEKVFRHSIDLYDSGSLDRKLNLIAYENTDTGVNIEDFLWGKFNAEDPDLVQMSRKKDGYIIAAVFFDNKFSPEEYSETVEVELLYDEEFKIKRIAVAYKDGMEIFTFRGE